MQTYFLFYPAEIFRKFRIYAAGISTIKIQSKYFSTFVCDKERHTHISSSSMTHYMRMIFPEVISVSYIYPQYHLLRVKSYTLINMSRHLILKMAINNMCSCGSH